MQEFVRATALCGASAGGFLASRRSIDAASARLGPAECVIFVAEVGTVSERLAEGLHRHLSWQERLRAARLVRPRDRDTYLAAHALLHRTLGRITGKRARFRLGPFGRPELRSKADATSVGFSLSHCDGLVACAVARGAQVGVDVELVVPELDSAALAASVLAPGEWSRVAAAPPDLRAELFCRFWTLREAMGKALGTGLMRSLPGSEIVLDPLSLSAPGDPGAAGWQLAECSPTRRHRAALALRHSPPQTFRIRWEAVELASLANGRAW